MKRISLETAKLASEKGYACSFRLEGPINTSEGQIIEIIDDTAYIYKCPYQAELQEWLRKKHGVSVLVQLDETLSYIWTITGLYPKASIQEFYQSQYVWCGDYEGCLEAGLQEALRNIE